MSWRPVRRDGTQWLEIRWSEHHPLSAVVAPVEKGFGWELIERMLPYELSARARMESAGEGVRVELLIPAFASVMIWRTANDDTATSI